MDSLPDRVAIITGLVLHPTGVRAGTEAVSVNAIPNGTPLRGIVSFRVAAVEPEISAAFSKSESRTGVSL